MAYSLAQAALAAGRTRSTILRAIQAGRLSAVRDDATGAWAIQPAELHRVYPVAERHDPGPSDATSAATALLASKDVLIAEQRATVDDLRRRLDASEDERRRLTLMLADQRAASPARRWWPWRRG